jgi:hypothetical protein
MLKLSRVMVVILNFRTLTSIQDGHLQQTYCSFNIGPYGKKCLKSSPLKLVSQYSKHVIDGPSSWMEVRVTGHNFENWPLKDHPCHVCFKLAYWFQRRRFLNIFPIGSYVKTMSTDGGHLGWSFGSLDIIFRTLWKKCLKVFSSETSKSV